jgi:hypothetical protein
MSSIKNFVKEKFPWIVDARNRFINHWFSLRYKEKPMQEVFTSIYQSNYWGDQESKSGPGSNQEQTQVVKELIEKVILEYQIKSVLDIPCGDFNWMKDVDLTNCVYTGGDIVQSLIANNQSNYHQREGISFIQLNLATSSLPLNDLLFCRDCLVHFSFSDIKSALNNIKRSNSTFFLTTTFPDHQNRDIITGDWRPLNLQEPPFNFPHPIQLFNEQCQEENGRYKDKSLGLWYTKQIPDLID